VQTFEKHSRWNPRRPSQGTPNPKKKQTLPHAAKRAQNSQTSYQQTGFFLAPVEAQNKDSFKGRSHFGSAEPGRHLDGADSLTTPV
jgi:hypothetical protein